MMETLFFGLLGLEIFLFILMVVDEDEFMWPILNFVMCIVLAGGVGALERTYVVVDSTGTAIEHTLTFGGGAALIYLFVGLAFISFFIFINRTTDVFANWRRTKE